MTPTKGRSSAKKIACSIAPNSYGFSPEFMELVKDLPVKLGGVPIGLLALTRLLVRRSPMDPGRHAPTGLFCPTPGSPAKYRWSRAAALHWRAARLLPRRR
jgi:hypothetical protein